MVFQENRDLSNSGSKDPNQLGKPKIYHSTRQMTPDDLTSVRGLIGRVSGVALLPWETDEVLGNALRMFPGYSTVTQNVDGKIIGCCFAGHNGLRGAFNHLAVDPEYWRAGVGSALIKPVFARFLEDGIRRVAINVEATNSGAQDFWKSQGFRLSTGLGGRIVTMTIDL